MSVALNRRPKAAIRTRTGRPAAGAAKGQELDDGHRPFSHFPAGQHNALHRLIGVEYVRSAMAIRPFQNIPRDESSSIEETSR